MSVMVFDDTVIAFRGEDKASWCVGLKGWVERFRVRRYVTSPTFGGLACEPNRGSV